MKYKKLKLQTKYNDHNKNIISNIISDNFHINSLINRRHKVYIVVKSIYNNKIIIKPIEKSTIEKNANHETELVILIGAMFKKAVFRINKETINRVMVVYKDVI